MAEDFNFSGVLPASKSLLNRALICASYHPQLQLVGESLSDDVVRMRHGLNQPSLTPLDCGAAGTTFRFLALKVARQKGRFILRGTPRLFARPQEELAQLLRRLGSTVEEHADHWVVSSEGWKNLGQPVLVRRDVSSQFASALVLNAWNLDVALQVEMPGPSVSDGYWTMTVKLVRELGMDLEETASGLRIPARAQIQAASYTVESDASSLFALAAFAALNGKACLKRFPTSRLQPDIVFVEVLRQMGVPVELKGDELTVSRAENLAGIELNLRSCPDLFPVLATLCAFANSPSRLFGAPQLIHKESNRLEKISELLTHLQVEHRTLRDGMEIFPQGVKRSDTSAAFDFDTDQDHRLAFAAALVLSQGFKMRLHHAQVVTKSFPEFWDVVQLQPEGGV